MEYFGSKRRILIVEDNELNREMLALVLGDEYDFLFAEDGKQGLEILSENYKTISLVLLDVYMPVMNGFEFLTAIKDDALLQMIPVIVTTGSDKLEDELKCLRLGAVDFVTKPYNAEIVSSRVKSMIKLKESLATLSAVETDSITGAYTLPAFFHHVQEAIRKNPNEEYDMTVADVQDLKLINSVFGMKAGDSVLQYLIEVFRKNIPNAIMARHGDKVYLFYSKEYRQLEVQSNRDIPLLSENSPIPNLVVNFGIYRDIDKKSAIQVLCDRLIMTVNSIKHDFTKQVAYYDSDMEKQLIKNSKMESEFEEALARGEFKVWYQPKIDAKTERMVAAEALVRWIPEGQRMICPGDFIPLFERDGLISRLDEFVFETVCRFQRERLDAEESIVPISVNLSRNSIFNRNTAKRYFDILKKYDLKQEFVPIELTESAATQGPLVALIVREFTKAGFSIHMDDFGTGYSSLSSLITLPIHVLKIDKSLIDQISTDKGNLIIRHVISLAQETGMKVVAEGVEERIQAELLRFSGCDMIQGYYYSAPRDEEIFKKYLSNPVFKK